MPQSKPTSQVPLKLGNIPKELKKFSRWILWRYTLLPNGRWTKTPHSAVTGHKIDATNFDRGVEFTTAVQSLRKSKASFDGLGFILGDGIAGIDVDKCIDEDGNLNEQGQRMSLAYAGTYAEVSPSGRGFKILVDIGKDPKLEAIGKNVGGLEIYGGRRYFTVTGALLPGHGRSVASMHDAFSATAREMGINKEESHAASIDTATVGMDMVAARELLDHLPFTWCDEYYDWLRAGMALHHEFDGSPDALELWDEWSQRSPGKYDPQACAAKWETFGRPGKEQVTIRTLVRTAQQTGWRAPRKIAQAVEEFGVLDDTLQDHVLPETGELVRADWWTRHSVGNMLRADPEPMEWVWNGLLLRAKVLVLAGSGGSSKSFLMLAAATQFALRQSWGPFELNETLDPGKVMLLYAEEDFADVHHRVHALRHTFMLTEEQIVDIEQRMAVLPLRGKEVMLAEYDEHERHVVITEAAKKLEARIHQYGVRLMVLDPMALIHGLDENDNRAIGHFIREIDSICMRTGCSIVLVHHFSKAMVRAREVNEANVRGASSLAAHARTVVVMHRLRRDEALEWGVPEDDHSRWTMFNVVKNNYGPNGRITWFNVNNTNGVIAPADTQLTYLNARDIRTAALAAAQQDETRREQDEELTETAQRQAREAAERSIQMFGYMEMLLSAALNSNGGMLPTMQVSRDLLLGQFQHATGHAAREALNRIKDAGYVVKTGNAYTVTPEGERWLEDRGVLR